MFLLQKLISRLLVPVPLILLAAIAGAILLAKGSHARHARTRRAGIILLSGALVFLWAAAGAPLSNAFLWTLEGRYSPLETLPADMEPREPSEPEPGPEPDPQPEAIVVLGGGYAGAGEISSAEMGRDAAVELGLEEERITIYPEPRNTGEEAATVAEAYGEIHVILLTSASHMPRSVYLFEHQGLQVTPAPTDFRAADRDYSPWGLFPGASALSNTERAWYEYMGLAWARITLSG